jgi:predicted acylesterase/phospholipase RssA
LTQDSRDREIVANLISTVSFVCAKFQKTSATTRLRSYRIPTASDLDPTILEAALATSAAPTYFSDVAIGGTRLVDGALGANNPAQEVEEEASDLWCEETGNLQPLVKCFISVGTGHPGIRSVSDKGLKHLLETLQKEATETESTSEKFLARWRDHVEKGRCFRFNVHHGLENVGLAEFAQEESIRTATFTYLQKRGTIGEVKSCVDNLRMKECTYIVQKRVRKELTSWAQTNRPQNLRED